VSVPYGAAPVALNLPYYLTEFDSRANISGPSKITKSKFKDGQLVGNHKDYRLSVPVPFILIF
jgi:hypothetical protein